jgi:hypothetical protein
VCCRSDMYRSQTVCSFCELAARLLLPLPLTSLPGRTAGLMGAPYCMLALPSPLLHNQTTTCAVFAVSGTVHGSMQFNP